MPAITVLSQEQINRNFIEFLEADAESLSYDIPQEFKYSEREYFYNRSMEVHATNEILKRINDGENAYEAVSGFCESMLRCMRIARTQERKEWFNTAYQVGAYLLTMYDVIAFGEEEE